MQKKIARVILICACLFMVEGCSPNAKTLHKNQHQDTSVNSSIVTDANRQNSNSISPLMQCNRDLESLRTVDAGQYRKFQAEYDSLMKTSSGFLSVKDDVSPEVAALARPRFQFALVNICYRIKDTLAQTLIRQAGGEK
jgi:uncharacterized membrane protein affecting hemolysin expression